MKTKLLLMILLCTMPFVSRAEAVFALNDNEYFPGGIIKVDYEGITAHMLECKVYFAIYNADKPGDAYSKIEIPNTAGSIMLKAPMIPLDEGDYAGGTFIVSMLSDDKDYNTHINPILTARFKVIGKGEAFSHGPEPVPVIARVAVSSHKDLSKFPAKSDLKPETGSNEVQRMIIDIIREKEHFFTKPGWPQGLQLFCAVMGATADWGDPNELSEGFREHWWVESGALVAIPAGNNKIDPTTHYFVIQMTDEAKRFLRHYGEDTQTQLDGDGSKLLVKFKDGNFGDMYDEWTIDDIPSVLLDQPQYTGIVYVGTVDFLKILKMEEKDGLNELLQYANAEEAAEIRKEFSSYMTYTVWWQGYFSELTPFSDSEREFQPDAVFKTEIEIINGKVDQYNTRSGYTLDRSNW